MDHMSCVGPLGFPGDPGSSMMGGYSSWRPEQLNKGVGRYRREEVVEAGDIERRGWRRCTRKWQLRGMRSIS
jgi:hypothetical protein